MPFSYRVTSDRSEDRLQRLSYSFAYLNRLPSNNFVEYTSGIHEFRRIIYENILFLFHFRYTIMRDYFKLPNKPFPSPKSSYFQNEAKCKHYFCANAIFFLHENKNRFHINGFALSLALKQRLGKFRNCSSQIRTLQTPISECTLTLFSEAYIRTLILHRTILSFAEVQPS